MPGARSLCCIVTAAGCRREPRAGSPDGTPRITSTSAWIPTAISGGWRAASRAWRSGWCWAAAARGLAHIGVIRALREANVPIDMIGGTSMGAVISGLVAMGRDWKEMVEINRDAWLHRKPHKEYGLPIISLIRSRRLDSMAQHIWGTAEIEDLWLNYFCISCNLSTSEMLIHERGPLWRAIRASASLPGVFVPVLEEGNILVDGGIVNNLPGDIMRERACRRVLVVDVGSEHEFRFKFREFDRRGRSCAAASCRTPRRSRCRSSPTC